MTLILTANDLGVDLTANNLDIDRTACRNFYKEGVLSVELIKDEEIQKVYFRCKDRVRSLGQVVFRSLFLKKDFYLCSYRVYDQFFGYIIYHSVMWCYPQVEGDESI